MLRTRTTLLLLLGFGLGLASPPLVTADVAEDDEAAVPITLSLGPARLFDPLLADPRWPHFYATYEFFADDPLDTRDLEHAGAVGVGETLSFVAGRGPLGVDYEIGLQAGVFALFDLDSPSSDLINADYRVGAVATFRRGDASALLRFYHQSSHLGDEFILRDDPRRLDARKDEADFLLSYDAADWARVYGGLGYIVNAFPEDQTGVTLHYGLEVRSPRALDAGGYLRPLAALNVRHTPGGDYDPDLSLRGGLDLTDPGERDVGGPRLQLLLEYQNGGSTVGQFYGERTESAGIGLHFYF